MEMRSNSCAMPCSTPAIFFSNKRDQLKRNQFGGTLGGPILKILRKGSLGREQLVAEVSAVMAGYNRK